jgi:hypothetical protein
MSTQITVTGNDQVPAGAQELKKASFAGMGSSLSGAYNTYQEAQEATAAFSDLQAGNYAGAMSHAGQFMRMNQGATQMGGASNAGTGFGGGFGQQQQQQSSSGGFFSNMFHHGNNNTNSINQGGFGNNQSFGGQQGGYGGQQAGFGGQQGFGGQGSNITYTSQSQAAMGFMKDLSEGDFRGAIDAAFQYEKLAQGGSGQMAGFGGQGNFNQNQGGFNQQNQGGFGGQGGFNQQNQGGFGGQGGFNQQNQGGFGGQGNFGTQGGFGQPQQQQQDTGMKGFVEKYL